MSKASQVRAYNKAFSADEVLRQLGAKRNEYGLYVMPSGAIISAYPGRPGRVALMVSPPDGRPTQKNFVRTAIDDMRAFASGKPTAAKLRGSVAAAAPDLLAACEAVIAVMGDGFDHSRPGLRDQIRAAIAKARGK